MLENVSLNWIVFGIGSSFLLVLPIFYNYYSYTSNSYIKPFKFLYTYFLMLIVTFYLPIFIFVLLVFCFFECIKLGANIESKYGNRSDEEDWNVYDLITAYDFMHKGTPRPIYFFFWFLLIIGIIVSLPGSLYMIALASFVGAIFVLSLGVI